MGTKRKESGEELDARMLQRALREATKGRPSPNPHVGAVIVKAGRVVSIGHHARCGGPHAEVAALKRAGKRARGATLYITFEPCNHHGRTPPCTEAIIEAGIARVVCGCRDPVRPGGMRRLRRAGIETVMGVERKAAEELTADFLKFAVQGLPHVTLKAAVTLDGKLATRDGDSRWITGERARKHAHRMRARADAVLVGRGTVIADDPALTVRLVSGADPMRVALDSRLRTPLSSKLVRDAGSVRTLIFHGPDAPARKRQALEKAGVELVKVPRSKQGLRLRSVLTQLARRDVVRLLVEGGATLHGALLDAGLVDHAAVFIAPRILGDPKGIPLALGRKRARISDALQLTNVRMRRLGQDLLVEGNVE